MAGARLRLLDRAGGQVRAAASAPDGGYAFADIPAGAYLLEARGASGSLSGAAAVDVAGAWRLDLTVQVSGLAAEVVVIGAGAPLVVEEAAKALDVVDADEIARRNESSVAEALRTVPGLRVQTLGAPGAFTTVKTRGLPPLPAPATPPSRGSSPAPAPSCASTPATAAAPRLPTSGSAAGSRRGRRSSAGANPAPQLSLQPVAVGADDGGNDIG